MTAARRGAARVERMRRSRDRRRSRRILDRLALELADFDADGFIDAWCLADLVAPQQPLPGVEL